MMQAETPLTVLVVEDDMATGEFLMDFLDWQGYRTVTAASGQSALDILLQRAVDVVLLDRRLPDMDGFAVCREIRTTFGTALPVILLTADTIAGLDSLAHDAGVTIFLAKPFDTDVLLAHIAELAHH